MKRIPSAARHRGTRATAVIDRGKAEDNKAGLSCPALFICCIAKPSRYGTIFSQAILTQLNIFKEA
jgi:hypothetical protein